MTSDDGASDPILALAGIIGPALAAASTDRAAVHDTAEGVLRGPDRSRERFGSACAFAVLVAFHALPRQAPPPIAARPLAVGDVFTKP